MTDIMLTPQGAAERLLRRRVVRGSLKEFAGELGYPPARHQDVIYELLERVVRGAEDRVMICAPPGSGKSFCTSIVFPTWTLAKWPTCKIIAASHTFELSEQWGRKNRNLLMEHAALLGVSLRGDSQSAARFGTEAGGEYTAVGVGGSVLGRRADLIILDDPVRNRDDAASPSKRQDLRDWFKSDLRTRLTPGGRIVIISTRWHAEDLVGTLLDDMAAGGEKWTVLTIPAIAGEDDAIGRAPGEFLWEGDDNYRYADQLRREFKAQTPQNWAGMFQQLPSVDDGDYFLREWLKPAKVPPANQLRCYLASDFAVSHDKGDYTAHIVIGLDADERLHLCDVWRGQRLPDVTIERLLDLCQRWKPLETAVEAGQIKSSLGPFITKRALERQIPIFQKTFASKHDKTIRAQSIRARMSMNGLYLDPHASFYPEFVAELLAFPNGKYDDQVDALGLIGMLLAEMVPAVRIRPPPPKTHENDYAEIRDDIVQRPGESYEEFAWREEEAGQGDDVLMVI
jgi:predicted phage terminase large subunit-like protein